jgi:hypothetical protein
MGTRLTSKQWAAGARRATETRVALHLDDVDSDEGEFFEVERHCVISAVARYFADEIPEVDLFVLGDERLLLPLDDMERTSSSARFAPIVMTGEREYGEAAVVGKVEELKESLRRIRGRCPRMNGRTATLDDKEE